MARSWGALVTWEISGNTGRGEDAGALFPSVLAPWSIQSATTLMRSFDKAPPGGIRLPFVPEIRCTRRLCLEFPGTITAPELLPLITPAAESNCSPAGALAPLWQPAQLSVKMG